jgi:hypothetical protein
MCSSARRLKTRLLFILLFAAASLPPSALADDWISEKYLCALTIPTHESWTSGMRQELPAGEVVFHGVSMQSNEGIVVTFVPDMPSTNLRDPEVEKRVQEILVLQGWNLESGMEVTWKERQFLQFISRRRDALTGPMLGVSRATIRAGDLYILTAYGKGEANRAEDPKFMRIMNTFRFLDRPPRVIEQSTGAGHRLYKIGVVGSAAAAAFLIVAFAVTIFRSRHGIYGH